MGQKTPRSRGLKSLSRLLFEGPQPDEELESTKQVNHLCKHCMQEAQKEQVPLSRGDSPEARVMASPLRRRVPVRRDYEVGPAVDAGGMAMNLLTCKRTGDKFGCLIMPLPGVEAKVDKRLRQHAFKEIDLLAHANHPNVLSLQEFYIGKSNVYLVTELLTGGSLLNALLSRSSDKHTEAQVQLIFRQVLSYLEYHHERDATNRDLLLDSLLLATPNDTGKLKVVDFGLWEYIAGEKRSVVSTPKYFPPEAVRKRVDEYNKSMDMLSAGVVLYSLLSGEAPFYDHRPGVISRNIQKGKFSLAGEQWEMLSAEAKDLVSKLLAPDRAKRLTSSEAMQHDWVTGQADNEKSLLQARLHMRHQNVLLERSAEVVSVINQLRNEQTKDMILRCWWVLGRSSKAPLQRAQWVLFSPEDRSGTSRERRSAPAKMRSYERQASAPDPLRVSRRTLSSMPRTVSEPIEHAADNRRKITLSLGDSPRMARVEEERTANAIVETQLREQSADTAAKIEDDTIVSAEELFAPSVARRISAALSYRQSLRDLWRHLPAVRLAKDVAPITMPSLSRETGCPTSLNLKRAAVAPLRPLPNARAKLQRSGSSLRARAPTARAPLVLVRIQPHQGLLNARTQRWRPHNRRRSRRKIGSNHREQF